MDEELESRVIGSLDKISEYIESAEVFVSDQAPIVVQEMLIRPWINFCACASGMAALIIAFFIALRLIEKAKVRIGSDFDHALAYIFTLLPISMFFMAATMSTIHMLVACMNAYLTPRLYIIEKLSSLIN